ncbi:hypothetical protein Gotur_024780 [Gossypium turneri]
MALLRCAKIQVDKIYSRAVNPPTFLKKLMNITGMSEQWVTARVKQKGDNKCISWRNLKDVVLTHPDTKKRVDVFALSIYGLVIFPKALGHVDEAVTDLFDYLDKGITSVLTIWQKHLGHLMPIGERVRVDSSDVHSYYSCGSTVIFEKLIRFRIGSSLKTIRH